MIPLANLLDDAALKGKITRWIDAILERQHPNGWLGDKEDPHEGSGETSLDPWPLFVVFKALAQWHEATGDARILPAMSRAMGRIDALLDEKSLQYWAKMRWPELALSVLWLYDRTGEEHLPDLARKAQKQGYDWRAHFADFQFTQKQTQWTLENHVVNQAMALKETAVAFRLGGDETRRRSEAELALKWMRVLDEWHGQANGLFSGDESLAGRSPSQGSELCSVVEYAFSLEILSATFGEARFGDRLERIVFNALPATFKPDMWAHQYVQQANQVVCKECEPRVYTNNYADANIFGLEPNFGCCTANMHQGWPKFAAHLWARAEDGLAALAYAPCEVETVIEGQRVRVEVETEYPFRDEVSISVWAENLLEFALYLRVPAWCREARFKVDDAETALEAGFHRVHRVWSGQTHLQLFLSVDVEWQQRPNGAVALQRGPLVFALPVAKEWRHLRGEEPHADWEVHPRAAWNYALKSENQDLNLDFSPLSDCPFSPQGAPLHLQVRGRRAPDWELLDNAAAPPPNPLHSQEPSETLTLIPYGCTNLRVTEFPVAQL